MKQSRTTEYLQGKIYPGTNSPVKDITVKGNVRLVHLQGGGILKTTKQGLVNSFHEVLQGEQAMTARRSIRQTAEGKTAVTIGGKIQGERKEYASKGRALAAIKRAYPKAA